MPFGLDPGRVYDVDRDGTPREGVAPPPEFLSPRHRLVLGLFMFAAIWVGALGGLTVAAFVSGARGAAAVFALLTLISAPLLGLGPAQDWWRHRRGRRIRRGHASRLPAAGAHPPSR